MNINNNSLSGIRDEMNIHYEIVTITGGDELIIQIYGLDNLVKFGAAVVRVVDDTDLCEALLSPKTLRYAIPGSDALLIRYPSITAIDWQAAA